MIKSWNQRFDVKRNDRLFGVKFIEAHDFSSVTQMWQVMAGTIHMNKAEFGQRPKDKMVTRFEMRLYHPYTTLMIEFRPFEHRHVERSATSRDVEVGQVTLENVREKIVDAWIEFMKFYDNEEVETPS